MHNLLETSAKSAINLLAPPGTAFLGGFLILDSVEKSGLRMQEGPHLREASGVKTCTPTERLDTGG